MKKVIVLGKGELAIKIASWFRYDKDHCLEAVVPVHPEPKWTHSFTTWAWAAGVRSIESGHYKDISLSQIDLAFSVFYDKIIPKSFIDKCDKILNLHNSPLPKYRGVSPINWALKNEEIEHGVTIHEITEGVDNGPVVAQLKYSIYPEIEDVVDVYQKALDYGYLLFEKTLPLLDRIKPRRQVERDATYYASSKNHLLKERRRFTKKESIE